MTSLPAVSITDVALKYRIYAERNDSLKAALMRGRRSVYRDFWALDGISVDIEAGTTFGLIGRNGSGKSTLLKCISRILYPDSGSIRVNGRIASLLEVGSGFHPELSGRENVYLNGSILGMSRKEITRKYEQIVEFSGVREFIDQPVKNYSSGMYVRLGFSVAIHTDPEVLIVDEVLSVGDAAFREKSKQMFLDLKAEGKTIILVSHSMSTVKQMCDQVAWINRGKLEAVGDARSVVRAYEKSVSDG